MERRSPSPFPLSNARCSFAFPINAIVLPQFFCGASLFPFLFSQFFLIHYLFFIFRSINDGFHFILNNYFYRNTLISKSFVEVHLFPVPILIRLLHIQLSILYYFIIPVYAFLISSISILLVPFLHFLPRSCSVCWRFTTSKFVIFSTQPLTKRED